MNPAHEHLNTLKATKIQKSPFNLVDGQSFDAIIKTQVQSVSDLPRSSNSVQC